MRCVCVCVGDGASRARAEGSYLCDEGGEGAAER